MGASSAGGGASGRGDERTDSAKAKIKAATQMVAGLSLITAVIVDWNTVYLDGPAGNCGLRITVQFTDRGMPGKEAGPPRRRSGPNRGSRIKSGMTG